MGVEAVRQFYNGNVWPNGHPTKVAASIWLAEIDEETGKHNEALQAEQTRINRSSLKAAWIAAGAAIIAIMVPQLRIGASLSDSATVSDGVLFVLFLIAVATLVWTMLPAKVREPLTIFNGVLAIATIGLAIVSFLQWRTLDRTDETFRAGERAFVFLKLPGDGWQPAQTINGEVDRALPVVWENSGNSPTRDLVIKLYCVPPQQNAVENPISTLGKPPLVGSRLLGPKQTTWAGSCSYPAAALDLVKDKRYHLYIASTADYFDIFDTPHRTEACFEVINFTGTYVHMTKAPTGSFEDIDMLPQGQFRNCGRNCADKECDKP